jgi:hypothetical protein
VSDLAMALDPGWIYADLGAADAAAAELTMYFEHLVAQRQRRPGTSIGMLGNGLMIVSERPEFGARLCEYPAFAPAFVSEVLRYDSPVQLTGRRAAIGLELCDVKIAAGSSIVLALGAANRDPAGSRTRMSSGPDGLRHQGSVSVRAGTSVLVPASRGLRVRRRSCFSPRYSRTCDSWAIQLGSAGRTFVCSTACRWCWNAETRKCRLEAKWSARR